MALRLHSAQSFLCPLTPLIGRSTEFREIAGMLLDAATSLLTLVGPGGVGKTLLARHVAMTVATEFPDGAHFVELEHLRNPDLVLQTIAEALGVTETADWPLLRRLARHLEDKRLLLILDNMEQVIEASAHLTSLRQASPGLRILATSRESLRLTGERLYPITPLDLPPPGTPDAPATAAQPDTAYPAIQLFVERARSMRHDFTLTIDNRASVIDICRRTDGLPLAIELAAARLRSFPVETLASTFPNRLDLLSGRSRDMPDRLQTVRAAVQWSYDLLSPEERAAFRRLAIFSGGFTAQAAGVVADDPDTAFHSSGGATAASWLATPSGTPVSGIVDMIASLVDKSLVVVLDHTAERFGMLETIRDFALDQLTCCAETGEVARRHAHWYLHLAESVDDPVAIAAGNESSLNVIETELDNMRAALTWFEDEREGDALVRLCVALRAFWHARSHLREGYAWGCKAVTLVPIAQLCGARQPEFMLWMGRSAWHLGEFAQSMQYLESAQLAAEATGDEKTALAAVMERGLAAEMQGDDRGAKIWFERALVRYRTRGDQRGMLAATVNLADAAYRLGDIAGSSLLAAEANALANVGSNVSLTCLAYGNLGQLALHEGGVDVAWRLFDDALRLARTTSNELLVADVLVGMAAVALAQAHAHQCGVLLGTAQKLCDRFGAEMVPHHGLQRATLASLRASESPDRADQLLACGYGLSLHQALQIVDELKPAGPGVSGHALDPDLTGRERMVLGLLASGKSDRTIGVDLSISHRTVMRHVAAIFKKFDVHDRASAVVAARERGLLPPDNDGVAG